MAGRSDCASAQTNWRGYQAKGPLKAASILLVLIAVCWAAGFLRADETTAAAGEKGSPDPASQAAPKAARYRVISLRHIPAQKGKEYLSMLGMDTVSELPGVNMLLITGQPAELTRASAILDLVDSKQEYAVRTILPSWPAQGYASIDRIAEGIDDLLMGTFANPPIGAGRPKAIVDVYGDALITIAPVNQLDRIVSAFGKPPLQQEGMLAPRIRVANGNMSPVPAQTYFEPKQSEPLTPPPGQPVLEPAEPLQAVGTSEVGEPVTAPPADLEKPTASDEPAAPLDANESEVNGLFAGLLESLAEAEKKAAQQRPDANERPIAVTEVPQAAPPSEPNIVVAPQPTAPPEPNVAAAPAPIAPTEEPPFVPGPPPTEPNIVVAPQPTVPHEPNVAAAPEPMAPTEEPWVVPEPPAKELKDIALAEILKRLQALEASIKTLAEPKIEPKVEEVPVKIEPNEIPMAVEEVPEIEPNEIPEPVEKRVPKVMHPNEPNDVNQAVSQAGPKEPKPLTEEDDFLKLNLPDNLPLVDFLSFAAEYLELDYIYDPKEVVGNVNILLKGKLRGKIKLSQLYALVEDVMQFHGFVMTRRGSLVTIRPKARAESIDPQVVGSDSEQLQTGDMVITRVFELMHIDTASAKNLLDQMKLDVISITPIEDTGKLLVTGYAKRMGRIEKLLDLVDVPGEPKQFSFRKLQYTMAEVLAPKVKTLAEEWGTVSITIAAAAPTPPTPTRTGRPPRPPTRRATPPPTPSAGAGAAQPGKPTVYLEADERTNRILMIGLADQLVVVNELIDALDVAQEDLRSLRLYEIKHVDAEEVRAKLEELGIVTASQRQTGRRTTARERITPGRGRTPPQPGQPGQPAQPTAALTESAEGPLIEEPQVVIIETINSLLVNATPEQHIQIATIIGYVDNEMEAGIHPYIVYPLENQDPESLQTVLNQLIQETVAATQEDKDAKVRPTTAATTTQRRTEEDIVIIADKNTFSLIVYASKKNQQWIENLIRLLDRRRPQVLIDVTLVQIKKVDVFNMDLSILAAIPDAGYTSEITSVNSDIFDLLTAPESDRSRFIEFASSPSLGGFQGFYGDEKISALLTAIQEKSYGRVMDRPKLLVNDNEPGTISTVETTYVKRTSTSVIGTDNPQTTEATVFDDYSAGITLNITPHISEGDMLRLEISLNRSGFTSELGGAVPPDKQDANIETVVTVPDKSTIILGGIEQLQNNKGGEKIPFLGDLPLIGGLFRNVARDDRQNRTYVFVKAHILRPRADTVLNDLKQVSLRNREAFEALEKEMGEYQDWPGLKPYPLDPVRILETD